MTIQYHRQREYLRRAMEGKRISHAYLLCGADSEGIRRVAFDSARLVTGDDPASQPIVLGVSEPLVESPEERTSISIDDIRELKRRMALAAAGDRWRVAIIDGVERLTSDAANAFLKLLEEPGARTLFFLIASSRERVMPTIASRAPVLYFGGIPARKDTEISRSVTRFFQSRAVPELFQVSEKVAFDALKRREAVLALFDFMRRRLLENSGDQKSAATLRRVLRAHARFETSNANPRLFLDYAFLEAVL